MPSATTNNASDIMLWGNGSSGGFYQIISKETFGSATPSTVSSLTTWNDSRKARGVLSGAANGNILSLSYTPYHYYDGTTNTSGSATNGWANTENGWVPTTGHFATYTPAHAAGGSGVNKTFGWRCGVGVGVRNHQYGTSPYVAFWPWHDDAKWGVSGGAAAIAAGEGSGAWTTAVASALSPNSAAFGASWNGVQRTLLWDWTLLCRTAALYGVTHTHFDLEDAGDADSGGMGTQAYQDQPGGQTEAQTRLYIKLRAQQMATIQANEMPNSDMGIYYHKIPGGLRELNYYRVLGGFAGYNNQASSHFIAGFASVSGIRRVFLREAVFYKGASFFACTYDNAYRYDQMGCLAYLSTLFTDTERKAAMARLAQGGGIWPTNGVSGSEIGNAMTVPAFQQGLTAAVKWGMGGGRGDGRAGQVSIFAANWNDENTGTSTSTDHAPYNSAFAAAAVPANADLTPPVVTCTQGASSVGTAATIVLSGTITDNLAPCRVDVTNAANSATFGCRWTRVITFAGWNMTSTDMANNDITARGDWTSPAIAVVVGANDIVITGYDTHDNAATFIHTHTRS